MKIKNLTILVCVLVLLSSFVHAVTFLEEEAGISAYVHVGQAIDLSQAEGAYRTIEKYTDEYIVGSVGLPDWSESEDAHVYVSSTGWIVSYYIKDEPASKIMQWIGYDGSEINTTKLEDAMYKVCSQIGISYSTIKANTKYYDFEYPNANRLMLIADRIETEGTDTFDFMIPSENILYEGSWSHYSYDSYGSNTKIDETTINTLGNCNDCSLWAHGHYTTPQMLPDVFHTVSIYHDETTYDYFGYANIAVALVYQE